MSSFYLEPYPLTFDETKGASLVGRGLFFDKVRLYGRKKNSKRDLIAHCSLRELPAILTKHFSTDAISYLEKILDNLTQTHDFDFLPSVRPAIMGIVNVTPDSFSDGGRHNEKEDALRHAKKLIREGADILDIGGESTRPYADIVPIHEEIKRTEEVIKSLAGCTTLSIDTRNSQTMRAALKAGAHIVNDVSALTHDEKSAPLLAQSTHPIILMHMQGTPQTMQDNPQYKDVLLDIYDYFASRLNELEKHGIAKKRIILDVGIGFGKTKEHNRDLLAHIALFHGLGCPLLIGVSRKKFIDDLSGAQESSMRLAGSVAAALYVAQHGVQMLRVHDVFETCQALNIWQQLVTTCYKMTPSFN